MSDRTAELFERAKESGKSPDECMERNPHFHARCMEIDGFCEICGEVDR